MLLIKVIAGIQQRIVRSRSNHDHRRLFPPILPSPTKLLHDHFFLSNQTDLLKELLHERAACVHVDRNVDIVPIFAVSLANFRRYV